MSFFDELGSKFTQVGNQVTSKSKDSVEQLRLNNEIKSLRAEISRHYTTIGSMYYAEQRANGGAQNYAAELDAIDQLNNLIADKEARLTEIRTQVTCPVCGMSVTADSAFCLNCGSPIQIQPAAANNAQFYDEEPAQEAAPAKMCPKCGEPVVEGYAFCMNCGTKL